MHAVDTRTLTIFRTRNEVGLDFDELELHALSSEALDEYTCSERAYLDWCYHFCE
jgi:hypothetical protein